MESHHLLHTSFNQCYFGCFARSRVKTAPVGTGSNKELHVFTETEELLSNYDWHKYAMLRKLLLPLREIKRIGSKKIIIYKSYNGDDLIRSASDSIRELEISCSEALEKCPLNSPNHI